MTNPTSGSGRRGMRGNRRVPLLDRLTVRPFSAAIACTLLLLAAIPTLSDGAPSLPEIQKGARDARARETVLTEDVSRYTARVRAVEARLAPVQARADALSRELAGLRSRRRQLTGELQREVERLAKLRRNLAVERDALARRLSAAYRVGEPNVLQILLQSRSLSDISAVGEVVDRLANQDQRLIVATIRNRNAAHHTRDRIAVARAEVLVTERRVSVNQVEAQRTVVVIAGERSRLIAAKDARRSLLANVTADRRQLEAEARGLRARSEALARKIRAATPVSQPSTPAAAGAPSAPPVSSGGGGGGAGLSWPVRGPIVSPFGPRWGRMHEGIDIAASTGTPIGAAASGTVIVAGWSGGYGNLVVVSHGNIATAYAHMSSIAVSAGQSLGRGTIIGAVGCTGRCFGPHVHFEVRVGGVPRNPIAYL